MIQNHQIPLTPSRHAMPWVYGGVRLIDGSAGSNPPTYITAEYRRYPNHDQIYVQQCFYTNLERVVYCIIQRNGESMNYKPKLPVRYLDYVDRYIHDEQTWNGKKKICKLS